MDWPHENSETTMSSRRPDVTKEVTLRSNARKGSLRVFSLEKDVYTSGQAARLLGIPSRTLRRYLSIGKIEGQQNPITQTWQITAEALAQFIAEQGGEAVIELKEISVLIIDNKKSVGEMFRKIGETSRRPIRTSEFQEVGDALIESGVRRPDLIVIDTSTPYYDGVGLLRLMRSNPHTSAAKVLAVTDDPSKTRELESLGAATSLVKPYTFTDLAQTIDYMFPTAVELPS